MYDLATTTPGAQILVFIGDATHGATVNILPIFIGAATGTVMPGNITVTSGKPFTINQAATTLYTLTVGGVTKTLNITYP
jgi:hypothetical protein